MSEVCLQVNPLLIFAVTEISAQVIYQKLLQIHKTLITTFYLAFLHFSFITMFYSLLCVQVILTWHTFPILISPCFLPINVEARQDIDPQEVNSMLQQTREVGRDHFVTLNQYHHFPIFQIKVRSYLSTVILGYIVVNRLVSIDNKYE